MAGVVSVVHDGKNILNMSPVWLYVVFVHILSVHKVDRKDVVRPLSIWEHFRFYRNIAGRGTPPQS